MNYPQSLDYLESLVRLGIKAGLERTRKLAAAMGDPQKRYPSILVAGTNGKGSVSAFLESILRRAGFRTGLYVSPHLVDVRERISVGGGLISREDFAARMTTVRQAAARVKGRPTFFEVLTLAAFDHFAQAGVDAAVLEVGLGGRLDCTNIVDPRLSVVTNIGLDHQEWLGDDLPSIAREKAGIFRKGTPALTGSRRPVVVETLRSEALRRGTPLGYRAEMSLETAPDGWVLSCPEGRLRFPPAPLAGRHQVENAALAVRAALVLREQGWDIPDSAVIQGVAATRWPGRLQKVLQSPATYLDGAHNPDACETLLRFAGSLPGPRALVFTCMRDKPAAEMLEILRPAFERIYLADLPMKRCMSGQEWSACEHLSNTVRLPDPMEALHEARQFATRQGSVVAAGSLYLVGYLLARLRPSEESLYGVGL